MAAYKEWFRKASSGEGEIFCREWRPEQPLAILQIAHGMAEHSGRYQVFAAFLAENGFLVCMEDHAGHGPHAQIKGHFANKDGWEHVLTDMKGLMDEVSAEHPQLPLLLMGHSMGSFLARSYIIRYGEKLSGCILMGTAGPMGAVRWGKGIAKLQMMLEGPRVPSPLLAAMATGPYNRRIKHPVNRSAWICSGERVALDFEADPHCAFIFTAAGYYDMFTGLLEINSKEWAEKVPRDMPIFLLAGEEDAVGNYGKGVREVAKMLEETGHDRVTLKLYPGLRHELINEVRKEEVYQDILHWLNAALAKSEESDR